MFCYVLTIPLCCRVILYLKGPEWDSSDDEDEKVQKDKMATNKLISSKTDKKQKGNSKKKPNNNNNNNETETERDATVVYIGHLPGELEELDLKNFLQQFGTVVNIRLSRSTKTGKSRGYAFARFEDAETASIVADTLQGYFLESVVWYVKSCRIHMTTCSFIRTRALPDAKPSCNLQRRIVN